MGFWANNQELRKDSRYDSLVSDRVANSSPEIESANQSASDIH